MKAALFWTADQNKKLADRWRTPAPVYNPGQKVLGGGGVFKGIPLKNEFKIKKNNLSPQFIEPLFIDNIVKPSAINVQFNSVLFI